MKGMGMRGLATAACLLGLAAHAETVRWERAPIPLQLEVGRERMVAFPLGGDVGLPGALVDAGALRVDFVNDTAYWNAYAPFESHRVPVRLADGTTVLFDVSAGPPRAGGSTPGLLRVALAGDEAAPEPGDAGPSEGERVLRLIRFAVQQDYAPARVAGTLPGAVRGTVEVDGDLARLYRHADAARLEVLPRGAWAAYGLHVTGLEFVNAGDAPVTLDPRLLQHAARVAVNGHSRRFVAASWLAAELAPAGRAGSSTMVYVVTRRPFAEVVRL
ncbi:MAG: DUF3438 family protein [Acidobacteria bacterium]|nr:DUF3438 family protein [Acidobacteriota bacterium]